MAAHTAPRRVAGYIDAGTSEASASEIELRAERLSDRKLTELQERAESSEAAMQGAVSAGVMVPWVVQPASLVDFYMKNPWLSAVGNLLADAVSSAEVELNAREYSTLGDRIDGPNSEEEYALAMAWLTREDFAREGVSELDFSGFAAAASRFYDTTGNLFAEILRNDEGTGPEKLVMLLPQFVFYELGTPRGTVLLQIDPYTGKETRFLRFGTRRAGDTDGREFLHERRANLVSSVYGLPPWIEAHESAELDNAHRSYLKGFFKAHAAPRWFIQVTEDAAWTDDRPDKAELEQVFEIVKNYLDANRGEMAGRNLVLYYQGGITVNVEPMDIKIEDPTFQETAMNARNEMLAVRHISLIDLGLPEGGYRATAETQSENFREHVLRPFSDPVVRMVNRVLHAAPPHGLGVQEWDLQLDFRSTSEVLGKMKAIREVVGVPILSPDEGRDMAGYEGRGLVQVYAPASVAPLDGIEEELALADGRRPRVGTGETEQGAQGEQPAVPRGRPTEPEQN